jgi:hypothetical protein
MGSLALEAHHHGCPKKACEKAAKFLKHNGDGIKAFLEEEVTGHAKTFQDMIKIKLELLEKATAMDPPIPFICHKLLKKVKEMVKMAVIEDAMKGEDAAADAGPDEEKDVPKGEAQDKSGEEGEDLPSAAPAAPKAGY